MVREVGLGAPFCYGSDSHRGHKGYRANRIVFYSCNGKNVFNLPTATPVDIPTLTKVHFDTHKSNLFTMLISNMDRSLLEKTIAETSEILLRDPNFEGRQSHHFWSEGMVALVVLKRYGFDGGGKDSGAKKRHRMSENTERDDAAGVQCER